MQDIQLAEWLAGEFDNQAQAREDPAWYVPLRLWHRPLPHCIQGKQALFAEQANLLDPEKPYRQRVLVIDPLPPEGTTWTVRYWAFRDPSAFRGAGANPELLVQATESSLEFLPGCALTVTQEGQRFYAKPDADARCCFTYDGKLRQVVLGLEVTATELWTYDRGVDPETGKSLWGAMMGPYQYQKQRSFAI